MPYSYYVGAAPRLVVADMELFKEVMVKEFDSFADRGWMVMSHTPHCTTVCRILYM